MDLDAKARSQVLHMKPSTLYAWAARGNIPCVTIHGLVRFPREEIARWLASFHL